ncbi:PAS domain-containing sensor histidine kinase [Mucilaginibacter sp. RS28]|uniref:histidine kinase n=1 Tax=Mucilaginibacter straminoryzae TaxID=2932774 RepID=A0A9X1X2K3_9SPHI|nr:PAS domain-containing sensor histidine kinase [Mucilaginibacter straminoryzae]MCJ8209165.1 PAS domain-containing sensor histidine kinase [Mucilaginibacter straminoryzae]
MILESGNSPYKETQTDQFAALMQNPGLTAVFDITNGTVIKANEAFHTLMSGIESRNGAEFPNQVDFQESVAEIRRTGQTLYRYETPLVGKTGTIWFDWVAWPYQLAENETYVIVQGYNVTERVLRNREVGEHQLLLKNITDAAATGLWMIDTHADVTFVNQTWVDWTGKPPEEHLGKGWLECVVNADRENVISWFISGFNTRKQFEIDFRIKRADGRLQWVAATGKPYYTFEGKFAGYVGSCTDITLRKESEEMKNEFIGMASHELKTPITSIKAYVQLLISMYKNDTDDEFLQKSLTTVNKQINKLTRLITDLLDISKIESGRLSLNKEVFVLNELLRETIDEVQHTTTQHDIVFTEESELKVNADRDRLAQVITNFLTNAVKYSPGADRIDVHLGRVDNEVIVTVRDYGIGINEDEQYKVFNRFYRVEGRNEQTFSGFGIGLYVASEIIRRHEGRIWVSSEKKSGSAFCFALQAAN